MPRMPEETYPEIEGREAYRKSLEQNHAGAPRHGRKAKPLGSRQRDQLARMYDDTLSQKLSPS